MLQPRVLGARIAGNNFPSGFFSIRFLRAGDGRSPGPPVAGAGVGPPFMPDDADARA